MNHPLRILHILRAPTGGLFRHVCDLTQNQAKAGLKVGLICDSDSGGAIADESLAEIEASCALGIHRTPMSRHIGMKDFKAANHIASWARRLDADILHGHGAKGGAYARLIKKKTRGLAFYTPHGGSLHYNKTNPIGFVYLTLEKILMALTDGLVFESRFAQNRWREKIGEPSCASKVVHNGLKQEDFEPLKRAKELYDFVFVGELRHLKGIDLLLDAIAEIAKTRKIQTLIVGGGPDRQMFENQADRLNIKHMVEFAGPGPARQAFAKGHHLVMPSRKDSFPYVVLEAAAANQPITATNVGGIPEIFGPFSDQLIPSDDVEALTSALKKALNARDQTAAKAEAFKKHVQENFTVERMGAEILGFYKEQLAREVPIFKGHVVKTSPAR